jgi:hypothetical protein
MYKHGPEISYVGPKYGQSGCPRILFTRLNPTWNADIGWFGTLESISEYRLNHPDPDPSEIFDCYLKGWTNRGKTYRGLWDAGTVTGHSNKSTLTGEEKRNNPRYGIQLIMEAMLKKGVFPKHINSSLLEFCAINNVVKCSGAEKNWNPSSSMYNNCTYYIKELDILQPHVLVVFGDKTDGYIRSKYQNIFKTRNNGNEVICLSSGIECKYFKFLHPLGQGKSTWLGHDIAHLCSGYDVPVAPERAELMRFKAGPRGESSRLLYKYVMLLVEQTKLIKDTI